MITIPSVFHRLLQRELITVTEFEFVRFLLQLDQNIKEEVLLAAAATIHAQLHGHVCLNISQLENSYLFDNPESEITLTSAMVDEWVNILEECPLISNGNHSLNPLVLEDKRLYLHRFWCYEQEIAKWIRDKSAICHTPGDAEIQVIQKFTVHNSQKEINWQHVAFCLSFLKDFVVISGGPGTGKTYTVLNIIAAHKQFHANNGEQLKVALAAPTGKAARRLAESIASGIENLPDTVSSEIDIADKVLTVHKLLGSDFQGVNFKFNEQNKLPYDLVIIDEASMLDITMWMHLVRAIHQKTKLIVLGDKDQLASVEAGSILGDICGGGNEFSAKIGQELKELFGMNIPETDNQPAINDSVVFLTKSYRFGEQSGIRKLAEAINSQNADEAISLLEDEDYPDVRLLEPTADNMSYVIKKYAAGHFSEYKKQENDRLQASNKKKILCALRKGRFGVEYLNANAEKEIKHSLSGTREEWYPGRIVMAKKNDHVLKIRNGEIGICLEGEEPRVKFEGQGQLPVSAARLQEYEPAYAITIHKSQGSEFDEVAIVLPSSMNSILSKEILYTSVTRARRDTLVIASKDIIRKTMERSVERNSGIRSKIWKL